MMKAKMCKCIALMLSIVMVFSSLPVMVMAETESEINKYDYSDTVDGHIGDDIYWSVYFDGYVLNLHISGNGVIPDYESPDQTPWADYNDEIRWVEVVDSPSYIGNNAFSGLERLRVIYFWGEASKLGENAFAGRKLRCVVPSYRTTWTEDLMKSCGGEITWMIDSGDQTLASGTIGDGVQWAVYLVGLLHIYGKGAVGDYASAEDAPWAELRDDIVAVSIEDGITYLGDYALADIPDIGWIYFSGDAPIFGEKVFSGTKANATYYRPTEGWSDNVMQNYGGEITWERKSRGVSFDGGDCGDGVEWTIYDDGELLIQGRGRMDNFASTEDVPWAAHRSMISCVTVGEEVSYIGDYAFSGLKNCKVIFSGYPPRLGKGVFSGTEARIRYMTYWDEDYHVEVKDYGGSLDWNRIYSDGITAVGSCSDGAWWELDRDGVVSLYYVYDPASAADVPWADYSDTVKELNMFSRLPSRGDVNGDGAFTNADLILAARYVVGLVEQDSSQEYMVLKYGDMNRDKLVTNADIITMSRVLVGLESLIDLEVNAAIFWFDFSDAFLSAARTALDEALTEAGIQFTDYDSQGHQSKQMDDIEYAIDHGADMLIVNVVDTAAFDAAQAICDKAAAAEIPVIFFNREIADSVVNSYDNACYVGDRDEEAGELQGQLAGNYIVNNYDAIDLNKDGKISYIMMKGDIENPLATVRTKYSVEFANKLLNDAGKPSLVYYDPGNVDKFQPSNWSKATAFDLMNVALSTNPMDGPNPIEVVFANNDDAAVGCIEALNNVGWNTGSGPSIPVFGIDYTAEARDYIENGRMTGSVWHSAPALAETIAALVRKVMEGYKVFENVEAFNIDDTAAKIRVPYEIKA